MAVKYLGQLRQELEVVKKSPDSHTGCSQLDPRSDLHMIQPPELRRSDCDTRYPESNMTVSSADLRPNLVNFHHSFCFKIVVPL